MAATETATDVFLVTAEVVSPEAFARFGSVLTADGQERLPIDLYPGVDVFRPALIHADTETEWLLTRTGVREFRLLYLERHQQLAQAFIPLGGTPFVSAMAPADAREEDGFPALDEIRAFIVPGDRGIQIDAGVWHEPPFGLVDNSLQLITSHQALTKGLGSKLNERREIDQLDVEKRNVTERTGKIVKIVLP
jgi:ureidoglycolate lyase